MKSIKRKPNKIEELEEKVLRQMEMIHRLAVCYHVLSDTTLVISKHVGLEIQEESLGGVGEKDGTIPEGTSENASI